MKPILSRRKRVRSSSERLAIGAPVDADLAGAGPVQAADQIQQRGFARAGRAHDGEHLAARDLQVDALEGGDFALAVKALGDTDQRNHLLG